MSILAFACPLFYLVRLLNVCNLIKCAFYSTNTLYLLYKAAYTSANTIPVFNTNVKYEKLNKDGRKGDINKTSKTKQRIKTAFDVLPRFLRQSTSRTVEKCIQSNKTTEEQDDREDLLLNEYYIRDVENYCDSDSDDKSSSMSLGEIDGESSSSSTDIDTVVQEYQDRIQVTSINNLSDKTPTLASSRTVFIIIIGIHINAAVVALGLYLGKIVMVTVSSTVMVLISFILIFMPQNNLEDSKHYMAKRRLLPYIAVLSVITNIILGSILLFEVWHGFVLWVISGLVLFCRCDCCSCEGLFPENSERQKINSSKINFEDIEYDDFVFVSS